MSLKIMGAALIIAGCGGFGFLMALGYKREILALKGLREAVSFMICELEFRHTPLPQLIRGAGKKCTSDVGSIFAVLASELEAQIAPGAESCMAAAMSKAEYLPKRITDVLQLLGRTLGVFDLQGQIDNLRSVQSACDAALEDLEQNRSQRVSSYQTLGLCAGAALAILFV